MDQLLQILMADPALADQMAQLGVNDDRQALLGDQMKRAQAMRNTQTPEGFMAGRVYSGPGLANGIAAALERHRGQQDIGRIQQQQSGLVDQDVLARKSLAAAMAEAMRRRQQAPPVGPDGLPPIPYAMPGQE